MPPLSPKNVALAARLTGLNETGPIRADDLDTLRVQTARLAGFLDRLDQALPPELLAKMESERFHNPN